MTHLVARGVGFSYGATVVFREVDLTLAAGLRLGLVGPNGCGKSTLLAVLGGILEPTEGSVTLRKGIRRVLLPQETTWHTDGPLLEAVMASRAPLGEIGAQLRALESSLEAAPTEEDLRRYGELQHRFEAEGGFALRHKAQAYLTGLGLSADLWARHPSALSVGQQRRAALAQVLLAEADLLLLDEPTNHLDVWALGFLEDVLQGHRGSLVVVSHDRYFLDRVVTSIAELDAHVLTVYKGGYTAFLAQRRAARARAETLQELLEEEKERLRDFIRRTQDGSRHTQARSRMKRLARLEAEEGAHAPTVREEMRFCLPHARREGRIVVEASSLTLTRGGRTLVRGMILRLERGQHLAIVGPNGAGKTSLLGALLGMLPLDSGTVEWGHHVTVAYLPQDSQSHLRGHTPLEAVLACSPEWTIGEARSYLARFLFRGEKVFQDIASLSGGERSRLALACLMREGANVLVLDEPTNHLDLTARDTLEDALAAYPGTIIMVTHDRALITRVAHLVLVLREGSACLLQPPFEHIWKPLPPQPRDAHPHKDPVRRRRRSPAAIERQILALEQKVEELKRRQLDPALASRWEALVQLHREQKDLEARIEALFAEWEAAHE